MLPLASKLDISESYEEYKRYISIKGNAVAAKKEREIQSTKLLIV